MKLLNNKAESMKEDAQDTEETSKKKALKISETWYYQTFIKVANSIINKPLSIFRLIKRVIEHLKKYDSVKELTLDVRDHLNVLLRLVKAYANGSYREISLNGIVGTLAALIYFVAPLDFIPDFLIIGLVDDVAILMWVYNNYRREIEAFLAWEDEKKIKIELETNES
jgi:uncharacterized membrane protein YkvA (DUF1232 family)